MIESHTRSRTAKALRAAGSLLLAVAFVLMLFPLGAQAKPSDEVKAQADAARAKLADMTAQLEQASDEYYTALEEHDAAVARMDAYIRENGYENDLSDARLHHEIYLSDARKVPPEKWKTVIRHPIRRADGT